MPDPATDPNRDLLLRLVESKGDIAGRFSQIRRVDALGGGGWFSLVFFGTELTTGRRVAIKVFHPNERGDAYRLQCFNREAEIAGRLAGQPDILECVAPLDLFVETINTSVGPWQVTFSFYVVEAAEGDLEGRILNGPIPPLEALDKFRAMCRAVQRSHARRIAHRDIKPSNFMLVSGGHVRLGDFGAARHFGASSPLLTSYDFPPGDLRYVPPEMLAALHDQRPELAFAADIFALGVCLFEMFGGVSFAGQVFDPSFAADMATLIAVPSKDRERIFAALMPSIVAGRPLPSVTLFGAPVPASIAPRIDALYRAMAALDYSKRLTDFNSIFRQVQAAMLILRNQEKYDRWRVARMRRLAARSARLNAGPVRV